MQLADSPAGGSFRAGNPGHPVSYASGMSSPELRQPVPAASSAERIDPRSSVFAKTYKPEEIARDEAYVRAREQTFAREDTPEKRENARQAEALESIVLEQTDEGEWLGPDAHAIRTSRFDDIKNGVDSVVEFRRSKREATYLALGIDVTFSQNDALWKKFEKIVEDIDHGKLAEVKYFHSEHLGYAGRKPDLPHVVVGVDYHHVQELMRLSKSGSKERLKTHPAQILLLEEMRDQLKVFADVAKRLGRSEQAGIFRESQGQVERILETKKDFITEHADSIDRARRNDRVYQGIQRQLRRIA